MEDDGELFCAPAGAEHPVLQERSSGWGLERKGNVNRGRSAAAGLLAFSTGALGCQVSVHRSWMGHRVQFSGPVGRQGRVQSGVNKPDV